MGMILRIASSRIVGQGDIVGRSGYFSLNLSANSVMRGYHIFSISHSRGILAIRTFNSHTNTQMTTY